MRRSAATLLAVAVLLGTPQAAAAGSFADDDGLPAEGAIEAIARAGITVGCAPGRFCPAATITRGDMAVFLARAFGVREAASSFTDTAGSYAAGAIGGLARTGAVTGCGGTRFCPGGQVTRGEMAVMLGRLLRLPPTASAFSDTAGHFSAPYVGAIAARGITGGCDASRFCPDAPVSRADMAVFLSRALGLPIVPPLAPAPPPVSPLSGQERALEVMVAQARDGGGLPDVLVAPQLSVYARGWSETMAATGSFAHSALGFIDGTSWCWAGENIAWSLGVPIADIAATAHEGLMGSTGHRANILSTRLTHIGVGMATAPDGRVYTTEVFLCATAPLAGERPPG